MAKYIAQGNLEEDIKNPEWVTSPYKALSELVESTAQTIIHRIRSESCNRTEWNINTKLFRTPTDLKNNSARTSENVSVNIQEVTDNTA